MATINGGSGSDTISGTNSNDTINGNGGNDVINAGAGDDTVNGGTGDDTLNGGSGDDTLNGGDNNDTLNGGSGDDTLDGGSGNDNIDGGSGDDVAHGGSGTDAIMGGAGDDTLFGDDDNDTIDGQSGADIIWGGNGNDILRGFTGDDVIHGNGGNDSIDGGTGFDTAVYDASISEFTFQRIGASLVITHLGGAGSEGTDTVTNVERLVFSDRVVNLGGGNNAPVAVDDSVSIGEDSVSYSSGTHSVLDNDYDFEGNPLHVTPGTFVGTYGTLTLNSNGTYNYVLNANAQTLAQGQIGQDNFNYTVSDGSATDTGKLTFNITGANDAPVANPDTASGTENQVLLVDVLANDTDVDNGHSFTVVSASAPPGQGSVSVVSNKVQFDPGTDFDHLAQGATATVVVNYTMQDEHGASSSSTLTITVTGTNDAPVAHADTAATTENQAILVDVLANDSDVDDGHVLTVTGASAPSGQGSASVVGNQVRFDPGTDFDHLAQGATATVVVNYTMQDEHGAASASTVTITVTGTNDAPVANADTASTTENQTILIDVLANDSDVDDGHVLTVTGASAPAGQGSASVVGNQVQFDPGTDFDHLAQGATATVVVNYTIQDEHGAASASTVTITVTGTNDAPVAVADTAATTENQAILVDVLANDTDVDDGHSFTVVSASAPSGQGSASVVGNQVQFDPGTDFDHLAQGATQVVTVNYTMQDEHGASSSSTVTITVTGTNDAPVAVADTASGTENQVLTINVLANDTDVDDGHSLTVVSASAPSGQGTASVVGNQVRFDPGTDFDHLAVGETQVVTVNYGIQDEHGAPSSSTVTITVTGTNDAPTIDAGGTTASGSVTELPNNDPQENVAVHHADGTIAFADVDTSDTHSASATAQGGGYLGTFTLDPVDQGGDTVAWHFSVSDADLDSLNTGDTLTQVYTIEIDDGHGGTVDQDVTITIHGTDDNLPPVANDDSYNAIGNVTLHVNAATGVLANDSDDGGVGTGPGQADVTAFDATSAHGGTVSMNPDGSFSYTSAAGFNGTDSFTYTLTDADGATDTATVTVTVGPSVWFIDNAALGSANTGTETDPFTSLASFNAAQGTANGPAANELIYLRQGTGTYTEADGINLLNGQTLVGGGENLVVGAQTIETATGRPTIVVTGAGNDGVDVAQNNTVSGFDIGSVTRAGISDSNGTVGTLNVHDVGKSGAGQIADIDQGGNVNVTLNNASSTGSTGGAIDLHGIGGSFTVTGATSITGSQTGGGLNASGDTNLAVSFQGGLTASTGSATAIGFTSNSGSSSLAVAGGMALTTTTGTALLVQNGGTVTVTGSGNTIATTGGSAVNITNSTIGGAGVTLQSASSVGGTNTGIVLDNAGSGGFSVTGLASIAGTGGTIANKTGANGATLQGNGVYINNTSNVSLDNMSITGNANHGILGNNDSNFHLIDSTLSNNGNTATEGGVVLNNLTGTSSLLGNVIGGSAGDNVHVTTSAGSLNLTIADSANDQAIIGTTNNVTGNDGVHIQTSGTGSLTLLVDGVDFQGARANLLEVQATGSATQNIVVSNDNFHNLQAASVGSGVLLDGGGTNINVDYRLEDNSLTGSAASAINASYVTDGGTIRGFISGNTIGVDDGVAGTEGSTGGDGITAGIEKTAGAGTANYYLIVENNDIHDIVQGNGGISLRSAGGDSTHGANLEANLHDNVIDQLGFNVLAGLYTQVGGTAGSGDFSHLGLELDNNVIDATGALLNAVFLDQISSDAHYSFPNYPGSGNGEFFGGTASTDLDTFWAGKGNVMTNGDFPSFPGGVDASLIQNADNAPIAPPWYP